MEWISTKDRLPKYGERVLVWNSIEWETGAVDEEARIAIRTHTNENGENWDVATDVTHWMPLPEPPKE